MKVTVIEKKVVDASFLKVSAGVRYWEDATVNGEKDEDGMLIPCRNGDYWEPLIDVDTGQIINWRHGVVADIHYKVCDDGKYTLQSINGYEIKTKEGYVPDIMCPEENVFGDYIIMKVNEGGMIANWKQTQAGFPN